MDGASISTFSPAEATCDPADVEYVAAHDVESVTVPSVVPPLLIVYWSLSDGLTEHVANVLEDPNVDGNVIPIGIG